MSPPLQYRSHNRCFLPYVFVLSDRESEILRRRLVSFCLLFSFLSHVYYLSQVHGIKLSSKSFKTQSKKFILANILFLAHLKRYNAYRHYKDMKIHALFDRPKCQQPVWQGGETGRWAR